MHCPVTIGSAPSPNNSLKTNAGTGNQGVEVAHEQLVLHLISARFMLEGRGYLAWALRRIPQTPQTASRMSFRLIFERPTRRSTNTIGTSTTCKPHFIAR